MSIKGLLIEKVVNFYVNSHDFNGIPYRQVTKEFPGLSEKEINIILSDCILQGKVSLNFTSNPHIKQYSDPPVGNQLEVLENNPYLCCIYPTENHLKEVLSDSPHPDKPFSNMLYFGKPQFEPFFFDVDVLEQYFNDPRYWIHYAGYVGSIGYKSEQNLSKRDHILLENFGLGFKKLSVERIVIVFLRYLNDLTPEHQQRWKTYLIEDEECKIVDEYYQVSLGEWVCSVSIYEAFIAELYHINVLADKLFGKKLFKEDYKDNSPPEFRIIITPTKDNYFKFIHVLDKLISENLDKNFFKDKVDLENKGTIQLFEEWFFKKKYCKTKKDYDLIFKPFKNVRKLRQKPAHAISENEYDKSFCKQQEELIRECYEAIRTIRLIFANHPAVSDYVVPDWLDKSKITTY